MQAVKKVSAQFAIILAVALAAVTVAAATTATTATVSTTHKAHSTRTSASASVSKKIGGKTHYAAKAGVRTVHSTGSKSSHSRSAHGKKRVVKSSWKSKGQHGISSDRTREIQQALIREHYLDGEASGLWDTRTQEACRKYQADNGWQSKVLPDSRALIKLGLGPDHKDVLNPETAVTSPYLPGGGVKTSNAMAPATASVPQPEQ